jgi:large subunit ribosomal protein L30
MANSKITIMQVQSPIGRKSDQRKTLIGLGLNKLNRKSILEDTPSIRGMVYKVKHLVRIIE